MDLINVISNTVQSVGYDPSTRILRVVFKSGGTYDYTGVSQALAEQMLQPHPWRRVGRAVKLHPTRKVT